MTILNVYNKKLIRSQKQPHRTKPLHLAKRRFIAGDNVIIISGFHKGKITKVLKQIGSYCFLEDVKEQKAYLQKAISRNKINNIHIKVHESNLMHYDTVAGTKSKVSYRYDIIENPTTKVKNKIRIRIYKASGNEVPVKYIKKSDLLKQAKESEETQAQAQAQQQASDQEENIEPKEASQTTSSDQEPIDKN